ncbi:hypothetical protein [Agrobacterium larrymoorei]|nr:hypothetical protein [Agrobacterium larrymoorei]
MATLDELQTAGVLSLYKHKHRVIPGRGREMWFFRDAAKWLLEDFCTMEPFYEDSIAPKLQAAVLLKNFVVGEDFEPELNFWHMRPTDDDVFELKTADLRIFGWFHRPRIFVAARAQSFERTHNAPGIHAYYRDEVVKMRQQLQLDEPKWVVGATASDVF